MLANPFSHFNYGGLMRLGIGLVRLGVLGLALPLLCSCGGQPSAGAPPAPSTWSADTSLSPDSQARRFLAHATFGPTDAEVAAVLAAGPGPWLDQQFALPPSASFLSHFDQRYTQIMAANPGLDPSREIPGNDQFYESFYSNALNGPDQVRQRVAFALSQILVVSLLDDNIHVHIRSVPAYYDMLMADALGNYRTLLEDVTRHPAMGLYLSTMHNQKENAASGLHPDENFAREVMQLFSIGLYQLNQDGTPRLDPAENPIPTYGPDDISGLSKVFTGLGWYAPVPADTTYWSGIGPASDTTAMSFYPAYHSTSAKTFLGTTLPAADSPDPAGDFQAALDTLFSHPNLGPFLASRLIQQLVTSNPSPGYVARAAGVFNDNGAYEFTPGNSWISL